MKDMGVKIKLSNFSIALFNFMFGIGVVIYLIFAQKIQIAIVVGSLVLLLFYIAFISLKKIEIMFEKIEHEELKKELKKVQK
ncbi:hypothetical protein [Halarcobacter anaerophilus]|uniref:hypothetical protein n=1 Tax=Halarcobacter anaerophilus TaxID=877500 RepID=UPI0005CA34D4|nr:hypothetical protein [Halarcobacter anaerophilus]